MDNQPAQTTKPVGRPTVMNEFTLGKLREAFLMGCNNTMACAYAEINQDTLYVYLKEHPDYSEKIKEWKQNPLVKATATIYKGLGNEATAQWYLERKLKDEYSPRQELTGGDGQAIPVKIEIIAPKIQEAEIIDGQPTNIPEQQLNDQLPAVAEAIGEPFIIKQRIEVDNPIQPDPQAVSSVADPNRPTS